MRDLDSSQWGMFKLDWTQPHASFCSSLYKDWDGDGCSPEITSKLSRSMVLWFHHICLLHPPVTSLIRLWASRINCLYIHAYFWPSVRLRNIIFFYHLIKYIEWDLLHEEKLETNKWDTYTLKRSLDEMILDYRLLIIRAKWTMHKNLEWSQMTFLGWCTAFKTMPLDQCTKFCRISATS